MLLCQHASVRSALLLSRFAVQRVVEVRHRASPLLITVTGMRRGRSADCANRGRPCRGNSSSLQPTCAGGIATSSPRIAARSPTFAARFAQCSGVISMLGLSPRHYLSHLVYWGMKRENEQHSSAAVEFDATRNCCLFRTEQRRRTAVNRRRLPMRHRACQRGCSIHTNPLRLPTATQGCQVVARR